MSFIGFLNIAGRNRLPIFLVVLLVTLLVGYFWPLVVLDENQKLYIFSTQAEIIAGIYALTVAGYVFMTEQRLRLVSADPTLKTTVESIGADQYRGLLFLAGTVVLCLCSCLLALLLKQNSGLLPMLVSNLAGVSFVLGVTFIVLFVCQAMHPRLLEDKSDQIKRALTEQVESMSDADLPSESDGDDDIEIGNAEVQGFGVADVGDVEGYQGDLAVNVKVKQTPPVTVKIPPRRIKRVGPATYTVVGDNDYARFMHEFTQLEKALRNLLPRARKKRVSRSRNEFVWKIMPMSRLIEELVSLQAINPLLAKRLQTILQFRNVLVHSSSTVVTERMVQLARAVRKEILNLYSSLD